MSVSQAAAVMFETPSPPSLLRSHSAVTQIYGSIDAAFRSRPLFEGISLDSKRKFTSSLWSESTNLSGRSHPVSSLIHQRLQPPQLAVVIWF